MMIEYRNKSQIISNWGHVSLNGISFA